MTDPQMSPQGTPAAGAPAPTQGAPHFSGAEFEEAIHKEGGKPVFVDFYADWCGPCKAAAPIIDRLSKEYAGTVTIAKLNVDENNGVAGKYGVMSIPTVLVFKDGHEVDRQIGFAGESGYRRMLDKIVPPTAKAA